MPATGSCQASVQSVFYISSHWNTQGPTEIVNGDFMYKGPPQKIIKANFIWSGVCDFIIFHPRMFHIVHCAPDQFCQLLPIRSTILVSELTRFEGRGQIHGIHGSEVQQFHPLVHTIATPQKDQRLMHTKPHKSYQDRANFSTFSIFPRVKSLVI